MNAIDVKTILKNHMDLLSKLNEPFINQISLFSSVVVNALKNGNKLFFIGNGGSAADAQHLAAEFTGRFYKERIPLPAISLVTDTSALTAIGNDYGFEFVFSRQIKALATKDDIVFCISTSGNSKNILEAANIAKSLGCIVLGLTGRDGGQLRNICSDCIVVPSNVTARIQEIHILVGHIICEHVDASFN